MSEGTYHSEPSQDCASGDHVQCDGWHDEDWCPCACHDDQRAWRESAAGGE